MEANASIRHEYAHMQFNRLSNNIYKFKVYICCIRVSKQILFSGALMPIQTTSIENVGQLRVTDKELTLLYEIGLNIVPTATDFVDFVSDKYQVSQSGVWYTLKKLKKEGLVDFTEKGEEPKPLGLTELGMKVIRSKVTDVQNR